MEEPAPQGHESPPPTAPPKSESAGPSGCLISIFIVFGILFFAVGLCFQDMGF